MIGNTLVIAPVLLLVLLVASREVSRHFRKNAFLWPPQGLVIALMISLVLSGISIRVAAALYSGLIARFPGVTISMHEPEYFAVQTMTTVGYGSALAPVDPGAPPGLLSGFQELAKWLMIP